MGTTDVELLDAAIANSETEILNETMDNGKEVTAGNADRSLEAMSDDPAGAAAEASGHAPVPGTGARDNQTRAPNRKDMPAGKAPAKDGGGEAGQHRRVPVAELQSERQKRQSAEAERDAIKAQLSELGRRFEEAQRRQNAGERPGLPPQDPSANPQAFMSDMVNSFNQRLSEVKLETSLQLAAAHHRDTFSQAYDTLLATARSGDRAAMQRIFSSINPGEALVQWYRERETLREIGTDPQVWLERKLEERLNDPQFLATAMERARGQAGGRQNGRPGGHPNAGVPNTITRMPPSLNRAAGANSQSSGSQLYDGSESSTFAYAFGR